MDDLKRLITRLEIEIDQLERDVHYVSNEVSINVLLYARERRQEKLMELKDRIDA